MNPQERPLLLRIPEVAATLGIARSLCYEMAREGRLPTVRIGKAVRVPRRRLEEWIERQTVESAAAIDIPSRSSR